VQISLGISPSTTNHAWTMERCKPLPRRGSEPPRSIDGTCLDILRELSEKRPLGQVGGRFDSHHAKHEPA
jgi:hypothetical protein